MAITEEEQEKWKQFIAQEVAKVEAPFFGVNTFDVSNENWEQFLSIMSAIRKAHVEIGIPTHLWAARNNGSSRRLLWINHIPKPLEELITSGFLETIETIGSAWHLEDSYDWYCVSENQLQG